jgi:hypothetical protein
MVVSTPGAKAPRRVGRVAVVGGASTCPFTMAFAHEASVDKGWSTFWEPRMWVELPSAKHLKSMGGHVPSRGVLDCLVLVQSRPLDFDRLPKARSVVVVGDDYEAAKSLVALRSYDRARFFRVPMTKAPFAPGRVPQCETHSLASQVVEWATDAMGGGVSL